MTSQEIILAIVPKVGASISIPSSTFIIYEAIQDHRAGKGTAIQRALVGMSVVDISASFAWFLSTWVVPKGTAPWAAGNITSCNFQGFLLQLAVGAPLYNCSLALYYVMVIRFNWKNEQLVKIEKYVHGFIIAFVITTSIAGLPLTMYNKVGSVCWVIGSPADCENSSSTSSDIPCDRGNWAWVFGISLFYGPLWICVFLTIIAMIMIHVQVRNTLAKNSQYSFQGSARRNSVMTNNHNASLVLRTGVQECSRTAAESIAANMEAQSEELVSRMSSSSVLSIKEARLQVLQQVRKVTEDAENTDLDQADDDDHDDDDGERDHIETPQKRIDPVGRRIEPMRPGLSDQVDELEKNGDIGLKKGNASDDTWMASRSTEEPVNLTPTSTPDAEAPLQSGISYILPLRGSQTAHRPGSMTTSRSRRSQRKQNIFAAQAILYSLSFFITWLPSTIWSVSHWYGVSGFGFDIAAATCEPLQGFWNMLIFIRNREQSQRKLRRIFGNCCCFWMNSILPDLTTEVSQRLSYYSDSHVSSTNAVRDAHRKASLVEANNNHSRRSLLSMASNGNGNGSGTFLMEEQETDPNQRNGQERSVQFWTDPPLEESR